jgi:NTE family protein
VRPVISLFAALALFSLISVDGLAAADITAPKPLPAAVPAGRPVVGLALEGGGALGMAHIGVLMWFEEHRIPVDRLSGTSMGALVGAMYASGMTPEQLRVIASGSDLMNVFVLQSPYADSNFRRRQDRREMVQALSIGLRGAHPAVRNALLADIGVREFLDRHLTAYNRENLDFDQLPIPFRCVAADLNTLDKVVISHGPLPSAVRASISIPGVFSPVQAPNGHWLVDGGIVDNVPTSLLRGELHADKVIAIDLNTGEEQVPDTTSIVSVLNRAFSAGVHLNEQQSLKLADLVVTVPVEKFSGTDYNRGAELIKAGYQAAEKNRDALLALALEPEAWKQYMEARSARIAGQPGQVRQVRVEGGSAEAMLLVDHDMQPLIGKPVDARSTDDALKGIQSNGGVTARWITYDLSTPDGAAKAAGTEPAAGLLVKLEPDKIGPPYLLISPEYEASSSNDSRGQLNLRLIDQNLGGFGSELRATARIGYKTELDSEYYWLLSANGWFVQPHVRGTRQQIYIWQNQHRVAERFQQNLETGFDIGRTFSKEVQISGQWRAASTRWSLRTGSGGGPVLSGTAQTGTLHLIVDKAEASALSPNGFRMTVSAGAFFHAAQSDNAPLVKLNAASTRAWHGNIVGLGAEVDSYLRANVAQPYRFTLGGPLRLSASSFDEYRGTDVALARLGLMHRIAGLPTGVGQGLYAVLGGEAGEVWSPEAPSFLRQDGIVGILANTPLGMFTVGVSVGDAGRRKVFITLGRWF